MKEIFTRPENVLLGVSVMVNIVTIIALKHHYDTMAQVHGTITKVGDVVVAMARKLGASIESDVKNEAVKVGADVVKL